MGGVRQMSVMATPPSERLSVRTTAARTSESRVRDAIHQEIERGGQVFFIHNRVETIEKMVEQLREWVPDATFLVAHGQMDNRKLEGVLVDFVQERADVLVCTAIIESGIDMPNVNTMLVHRADRFGLSQLYQLRGRVGRSDVRASCLLLVPEEVSREASKRLRVLVEHTRLGSGFHVAAADLELRGGGNVLGAAQSGSIDKVGYDTWVDLLQQAVARARGDLDRAQHEPEIEVPVDAFIPDVMITDPQKRLDWYRRIAGAGSPNRVEAVLDELEAEYGELPVQTHNLGGLAITRLLCREWGVSRCSWLKVRTVLVLHSSTRLSESGIEAAKRRHPKRFKIIRSDGLITEIHARFTPREGERPFRYLRWVIAQLTRE
jgi:transcription-repair coupling factor (superfamily II helicase)